MKDEIKELTVRTTSSVMLKGVRKTQSTGGSSTVGKKVEERGMRVLSLRSEQMIPNTFWLPPQSISFSGLGAVGSIYLSSAGGSENL